MPPFTTGLARMAAALLVCAALLIARPAVAADPAEPTFASPEAAVDALNTALASGEEARILAVLGPQAKRLIASGDPTADRNARKAFLDAYAVRHVLEAQGDARRILVIGPNDWPFPIPIVRTGEAWRFDTAAGAEELIDRRIGRNELSAIRTLLALVEAQEDYFARRKASGRKGAFARHIISASGQRDGLYWVARRGEPASPLAELIDDAQTEGYPGGTDRTERPAPYHGYLFRILTAQGPQAPGGARNYLVNGLMEGGFAVLASPAQYGSSGVVTFQVNRDGIVFQKDLGPRTAEEAARITRFDPDETWARVDLREE